MAEYKYEKLGADVAVTTEPNKMNATITKGENVLEVQITRDVEKSKYAAKYGIDINGGGKKVHYDASVVPEEFKNGLMKGIPYFERESLIKEFQNPSLKKLFEMYILDADNMALVVSKNKDEEINKILKPFLGEQKNTLKILNENKGRS